MRWLRAKYSWTSRFGPRSRKACRYSMSRRIISATSFVGFLVSRHNYRVLQTAGHQQQGMGQHGTFAGQTVQVRIAQSVSIPTRCRRRIRAYKLAVRRFPRSEGTAWPGWLPPISRSRCTCIPQQFSIKSSPGLLYPAGIGDQSVHLGADTANLLGMAAGFEYPHLSVHRSCRCAAICRAVARRDASVIPTWVRSDPMATRASASRVSASAAARIFDGCFEIHFRCQSDDLPVRPRGFIAISQGPDGECVTAGRIRFQVGDVQTVPGASGRFDRFRTRSSELHLPLVS